MARYQAPTAAQVRESEDCEKTAITVAAAVIDDALQSSPLNHQTKVYAAFEFAFRSARDDDFCEWVFNQLLLEREVKRGEWPDADDDETPI